MYFYFVVFVIGLFMGSFLNCLAMRTSKGKTILKGRSVCDTCGHILEAKDLIPVVSWILYKGKCSYCRSNISIRYPLCEIVCAFGYFILAIKYNFSLMTIKYLFVFSILFVVSLTDIDEGIVPDRFILLGVVSSFWFLRINLFKRVLAAIFIFFFLTLINASVSRIKSMQMMGMGDVKLFSMLALYFGFNGIMIIILLSCVFGILYSYVFDYKNKAFPFVPSIFAGTCLMMSFGNELLRLYMKFM